MREIGHFFNGQRDKYHQKRGHSGGTYPYTKDRDKTKFFKYCTVFEILVTGRNDCPIKCKNNRKCIVIDQ